jgi:hypothetical protein
LIYLTTDEFAPYVATWWRHHRAATVCAASLALLVVIGANLISAFGLLHAHNPLAFAAIDQKALASRVRMDPHHGVNDCRLLLVRHFICRFTGAKRLTLPRYLMNGLEPLSETGSIWNG